MNLKLRLALLAALAAAGTAHASVDLVATASLDGHRGDRAVRTAAPLENGAPGNLFGGIGSGLAYAGCDSFLAMPDRGPNAVAYDAAADDTTSYIPRFHTLRMTLAPSAAGAALPFTLAPRLEDTTLLWDAFGLYYGDGRGVNLPDGTSRLNRPFRHYFSGRSDNADPAHDSGWPLDARLDPEGIRMDAGGEAVYVSDEYGPYVYKFDRRSGRRLDSYALPAAFEVAKTAPTGDAEIAGNASGRVANKGMEGLAITPDGRALLGVMQAALLQDGGAGGAVVRIARIDLATHRVHQYAYPLTNLGSAKKPKYSGVSEIVAVNDHQLLVDERDGKGFGDGSVAGFKHVYLVDLDGVQEVGQLAGADVLAAAAVPKTDFLDVVAALGRHGIAPEDVPAKLEGLAFGPDVEQDGQRRHTLFIANDNDFLPDVTDDLHPAGADNPNRFFVFAFDEADLPGYQPQRFAHLGCPRR
ncbi:esterase-like activity of phytase family protein [Frateuria defendens]|uniref:esterase-like activity of phytase family protein n=1 Tax=Frateuria defendens TaxID=2219559 RepID=UPI00066FFD06|nr:esterase-like activity of phytase family protein [Frateuria defendens]